MLVLQTLKHLTFLPEATGSFMNIVKLHFRTYSNKFYTCTAVLTFGSLVLSFTYRRTQFWIPIIKEFCL